MKRTTWTCCGHIRHSAFCPDCASPRPQATPTVEAEMLVESWCREASGAYHAADTWENKAETLRCENDMSEMIDDYDSYSYGDRVRLLLANAKGRRKQGDRLMGWVRIVRGVIQQVADAAGGEL